MWILQMFKNAKVNFHVGVPLFQTFQQPQAIFWSCNIVIKRNYQHQHEAVALKHLFPSKNTMYVSICDRDECGWNFERFATRSCGTIGQSLSKTPALSGRRPIVTIVTVIIHFIIAMRLTSVCALSRSFIYNAQWWIKLPHFHRHHARTLRQQQLLIQHTTWHIATERESRNEYTMQTFETRGCVNWLSIWWCEYTTWRNPEARCY